ncbi:MAG: hypothetical protein ACE361_22205 [Aureliella sp.]
MNRDLAKATDESDVADVRIESKVPTARNAFNPYEPPGRQVHHMQKVHILLLALFGIVAKVTALCVFFIPGQGPAIAYDILAFTFLVAALFQPNFLRPLSVRRPTVLEVAVMVVISCVLHALLMPAVQM